MDFEISAGQVKALLKQGDKFTLLDVREPWELEKLALRAARISPWAMFQRAPTRNSIPTNTSSWFATTACAH